MTTVLLSGFSSLTTPWTEKICVAVCDGGLAAADGCPVLLPVQEATPHAATTIIRQVSRCRIAMPFILNGWTADWQGCTKKSALKNRSGWVPPPRKARRFPAPLHYSTTPQLHPLHHSTTPSTPFARRANL